MSKLVSTPLELQETTKSILGGNDYAIFTEAREVVDLGLPSDVHGEKLAYLGKNTKAQEGLSDLKFRLKVYAYELNLELTSIRSDLRYDLKEESNNRYTKDDLYELCSKDSVYVDHERILMSVNSLVERIDELMWILKSIMGKVA